jgi:peptidoglycan hydrolase CwlO-like protein
MDSLQDIQAAIADLDRQQKRLMRQIKHREKLVAEYQGQADEMKRTLDGVQDRWIALIAREREIKEAG